MGLFNHSRRTQARHNRECAMQIKAELEQSRDLKIQLLALPSPRAEGGLLWEDALSPFPPFHVCMRPIHQIFVLMLLNPFVQRR